MTTRYDELVTQAESAGVRRLVVGAVVADGPRVLALARPAGDFMGGIMELPSGEVEPGETLEAALAREVAEETGLVLSGIGAYLGHFDYRSGSGKPTRQLNFAVEADLRQPIVLAEHDAYRWIARDEVDEAPLTESVREILYRHWGQGGR